jgi:SET domain-containing protein
MPTKNTQSKPATRAPAAPKAAARKSPAKRASKIAVRESAIHGRGVYASRPIRKGERIIEYTGEIISWKEADRRPPSDPDDPNHTFFFSLDDGKRVIDANVGGNDARWINHSCDPNCETEETEDGRVYIQAMRDIRRGEELLYDYSLIVDERLTPTLKRQYQCRCGSADPRLRSGWKRIILMAQRQRYRRRSHC